MGGYLLDLLSDALKKQEGEAENRNNNVVFQGLLFLWVQDLRNRCTSYTASVISLTAMSEISWSVRLGDLSEVRQLHATHIIEHKATRDPPQAE